VRKYLVEIMTNVTHAFLTTDEFKDRFLELYPHAEKNYPLYAKAFMAIRTTPRIVCKDSTIKLHIVEEDGEKYFEVTGQDQNGESFLLEEQSWSSLLGMYVDSDLPELDIACHCLWEMTIHGWTAEDAEQVRKHRHNVVWDNFVPRAEWDRKR